MSETLERSRLAKIALAAWVNVSPEQLPQEKMWIEHPNHESRQAWDRVVNAILAEGRREVLDRVDTDRDAVLTAFESLGLSRWENV